VLGDLFAARNMVHLMCSRMDINRGIGYQRLEDNFGFFPILVTATASPTCRP
jgi:hypothetical protein